LFRKISDSAIIDGIRRQDDQILNWLYDSYLETIRHHVLKNSGSDADVSDVFQETIIALYRQISENELKLTSAQLRKKSRNIEIESDYPDEDDNESGNPVLERIVSRAFKLLSDDSQTILTLFSEGYSYQEIASMMNLKNETYARRKKYLSKEALIEFVKLDPEYKDYKSLR
jgi:RNA polymerase sigma factor (sigma-70 family)